MEFQICENGSLHQKYSECKFFIQHDRKDQSVTSSRIMGQLSDSLPRKCSEPKVVIQANRKVSTTISHKTSQLSLNFRKEPTMITMQDKEDDVRVVVSKEECSIESSPVSYKKLCD